METKNRFYNYINQYKYQIKKYDEKNYLNNKDILEEFKNDAYIRKQKILKEQYNKKNIINNYDTLVYKIANLLKNLGYKNSLECSILISYLINNGYLSYNNKMIKESIEDKLISKPGINIIEGYGVCRNYSAIHEDIFKNLSLYDKQFYCYEGIGKGRRNTANHVINLIYYNNNYYGIDIYNENRLYKFTNEFKMKEISLNSNNKLRYKPYYEITTGESTEYDIKKNLDLFKKYSNNYYIDPFEYDIIKYEIKEKIKQNKKEYIEFYNNNKKLIKTIKNSL